MATPVYVFISGPYSDDPERRTAEAIHCWHRLHEQRFVPFCPHLSHYLQQAAWLPYSAWIAYDLAWLARCDALLRLPGESPGADCEVARARELGIPVFTDPDALLEWREQRADLGG